MVTVQDASLCSAAGEEGDAPKTCPSRWTKTSSMATGLRALEREGLLHPKSENLWCVPRAESVPTPENDERIAFVDHVHRGLSFPLHPFLVALLCAYGVQLHDLPPNSVQHIAFFIVLCKCFLGVRPHWSLFKHIF